MKLVSGSFELPVFGGERGQAPTMGGSQSPAFKILETYIKHYPVEYHAQTAVEAALALREDLLKAEESDALPGIADVEIGSYDVAIEIIGRDPEKWRPRTRETADHSFPYCVAVALLDGKVTLRSFDVKRLTDQALHELMQKVRVVPQPEFIDRYPQAMPTRITVRTKGGKDYVKQIDYPLGHPKNRMSDYDVENKFRRLAAGKLDRARMKKMIDVVWKLDQLKDISALMPLLQLKGQGSGSQPGA
jgi:2-methylcitrate dehydratase